MESILNFKRNRVIIILILVLSIVASGIFNPLKKTMIFTFDTCIVLIIYNELLYIINKYIFINGLKEINKLKKLLIYYLIVTVFLNLFIYTFLVKENTIYFWDSSAYWSVSLQVQQSKENGLIKFIKWLYISILNDEYTIVIPTIITAFMKIFGNTFMGFALSVLNGFIIPFYVLISTFIYSLFNDNIEKDFNFTRLIFITFCVFCIPLTLHPMLSGYFDSFGLLLAVFPIIIIYKKRINNINLKEAIYISIINVLILISRRWYGFFIVSWYLSLCIFILLRYLFNKEFNNKDLINSIKNIAVITVTDLLILIVFFRKFLIRTVFNNYSDIYSGWKFGGLYYSFKELAKYLGVFIIIIIIVGLIIILVKDTKKYSYIEIELISLIQIFLAIIIFTRIQSLDQHHYYIITTSVIFIFVLGICKILNLANNNYNKRLIVIILSILIYGNITYSFINPFSYGNFIFSNRVKLPEKRTDIVQIQKLSSYLEEISDNSKIYVVSSSKIFNDDILRKLYMPYIINNLPNMTITHHVDKRDGFPKEFFEADVVIVADPLQYHLNPKDQEVIKILGENVLEGKLKNLRFMKNFEIDDGVNIKVYKKELSFTNEEIENIENEFKKVYPIDKYDYFYK